MKDSKIVDVAKIAGVSPSTVSRVLNGSSLVNSKTVEKVQQAITELGYIPNMMGKQLRSRKTMTLAIVVSDIGISYNGEIIKGVENRVSLLGYKLIICDTQNEIQKEREYLSLLMSRTVDALILVTPQIADEEIISYVDKGYAIGIIGRLIDHPHVPCSFTDNVKLAREAVSHFTGQGHQKIAYLSGYTDAIDSNERMDGYLKALQEAGLSFDSELVENGDFTEEGGYEAFMRLRQKGTQFTAIFAANDEMALGVYKACRELGILIPEQLAVAGVDDIRLTYYVVPQISSVAQPLYTMGAVLAEKLIDQINENLRTEERVFKLQASLIIKESSRGTNCD